MNIAVHTNENAIKDSVLSGIFPRNQAISLAENIMKKNPIVHRNSSIRYRKVVFIGDICCHSLEWSVVDLAQYKFYQHILHCDIYCIICEWSVWVFPHPVLRPIPYEVKARVELGILEHRSPSKKKTHYVLKPGSASDV